MKLISVSLLIVTILLCCNMAQPKFRKKKEVTTKPGYCPELHFTCPFMLVSECSSDKVCKGLRKCCLYYCQKRCVEPWYTKYLTI